MKKEYIFISYSRKDFKFAIRVANDLKDHGFNVWIDQSNIPGGRHWDDNIEQALNNSCVVVLIVSPASVKSENVKDEISYARDKNIHIIPIVYKETEIPLRWHRLQFININKDYKLGLKNLIECIAKESNKKIVPKIKKSKINNKIYLIAAALLLIFATVAILSKINNKSHNTQNISTSNQNIKLHKHNTVVIGNKNKDINITQK